MKPGPRQLPEEIDVQASEWIGRRDAGLTAEEKNAFEQWLSADARHAEALFRFETAWSSLGRPRRAGRSAALVQELQILDGRQRRRRARMVGGGIVACLLAGMFFRTQWPEPSGPFHQPPQPVVLLPQRQTLPDGSVAEFPAGTEIVVEFDGGLRRVVLKRGEAHFQVVKDPARPFVVAAAGVGVRAVGTAFAVQLGPSAVEVLVTEGRVSVEQDALPDSRTQGNGATIPPPRELATVDAGKVLVVDMGTPASQRSLPLPVQSVTEADMAARLAWRSPRVEFSGVPLLQVIEAINRYGSAKLVIDDPELAATALTGLFRTDDTEAVTHMLERGFGVRAERRGDRIFLSKAR